MRYSAELLTRLEELAVTLTERDECGVDDCHQPASEVVTLQPLDPIDHSPTPQPLCENHVAWARERNELAAEVAEELRAARRDIGQERLDEIQRLADPRGTRSEGFLMGDEDAEGWTNE